MSAADSWLRTRTVVDGNGITTLISQRTDTPNHNSITLRQEVFDDTLARVGHRQPKRLIRSRATITRSAKTFPNLLDIALVSSHMTYP